MFWKKPKKQQKSGDEASSREALIQRAKADLAAARAELGEETIAKMKALALAQQEMSKPADTPRPYIPPRAEQTPAERARELIKHMDKDKLADYIRTTSREDK